MARISKVSHVRWTVNKAAMRLQLRLLQRKAENQTPRLASSPIRIVDLSPRLRLRRTAANTLGLWALEMRRRDPALIVRLRARRDSRAISTNDSNLLSGIDLLRSERRLLRALAALATALLLGKKGGDPGVVHEVKRAREGAENDEVEEDARGTVSGCLQRLRLVSGRDIHLRVEEAGSRLDNADRLVVHRNRQEVALGVLQHGHQLQTQVAWVQLGREGVGHRLLRAGGDFNGVLLRRQVAHDARLPRDFLGE